jgi:hypothetical protein
MSKITRLTPKSPLARFVICTLDGKDITHDCFLADERGVVGLFSLDENGRRYLVDIKKRRIAREFHRGKVEISLREDAPEGAKRYYENLRSCP